MQQLFGQNKKMQQPNLLLVATGFGILSASLACIQGTVRQSVLSIWIQCIFLEEQYFSVKLRSQNLSIVFLCEVEPIYYNDL